MHKMFWKTNTHRLRIKPYEYEIVKSNKVYILKILQCNFQFSMQKVTSDIFDFSTIL